MLCFVSSGHQLTSTCDVMQPKVWASTAAVLGSDSVENVKICFVGQTFHHKLKNKKWWAIIKKIIYLQIYSHFSHILFIT